MKKTSWINVDKLTAFILSAQVGIGFILVRRKENTYLFQDTEQGGIADRPGDAVDVFHTHFGVAGKVSR